MRFLKWYWERELFNSRDRCCLWYASGCLSKECCKGEVRVGNRIPLRKPRQAIAQKKTCKITQWNRTDRILSVWLKFPQATRQNWRRKRWVKHPDSWCGISEWRRSPARGLHTRKQIKRMILHAVHWHNNGCVLIRRDYIWGHWYFRLEHCLLCRCLMPDPPQVWLED